MKVWDERTTAEQAQDSSRGTSIEAMVDTANALHADMWYAPPHQADDAFMERAAALIGARLDTALKVYVECSNETWNGQFSQLAWLQEQGVAAGLDEVANSDPQDGSEYWAGLKVAVRRAARAHDTFRRVLGMDRVVAVLAGQSAQPALNDQLLSLYANPEINPLGGRPDALAVAPYFGRIYVPSDLGPGLPLPTTDALLDETQARIATSVGADTHDNRRVADEHGVSLIAYEAGQHLLATQGLEENPQFVALLTAANRDPRTGELYREAQQSWLDNGGGLAVYYDSCETPSKYGSWGALEYQNQPLVQAPKMAALRELAGLD